MEFHYPYHSIGTSPQEELEKFTVLISRLGEETALGAGILVTNGGLIVTCFHLIDDIIQSECVASPKKYVNVSFSDGRPLKAEILKQYCREDLDVAILKIDKVPAGCEEAKLGIRINEYLGHRFESLGYRKNIRYSYLPSGGTPFDIIHRVVYSKDYSSKVLRLKSKDIRENGMSGSAIYHVDSGLVVGMMRFHDEDRECADHKAPYAILVSDIVESPDEMKRQIYEWASNDPTLNRQEVKAQRSRINREIDQAVQVGETIENADPAVLDKLSKQRTEGPRGREKLIAFIIIVIFVVAAIYLSKPLTKPPTKIPTVRPWPEP